MKRIAALVLGLSCFVVTGCFDIEQTLTLEKNMSGKAGFSMKVNMEPMVTFMAQMQREMAGKSGQPSAEELAAARAEFLKESKSKSSAANFDKEKKEIQASLPAGVTLLDATMVEDGLKIAANVLFGFDDVKKLASINLPDKKNQPMPNPMDAPFSDLKVTDDGKTVLITTPVENPMADAKKQGEGPVDPEMMKQMSQFFQGLRVAYRITAPFEILEHNATRREGNTLIWEYDMKTLEKSTPAGVRVRYRK